MASIQTRELKSGTVYRVHWREDDGTQRNKSFQSHEKAKDFAAEVETDKNRGDYVSPSGITFKEAAQSFLRTTGNLKPKTEADYESLIRVHLVPELGETPIQDISAQDCREFASRKLDEISVSRTKRAYWLLKAILDRCVEDRIINRNPAPDYNFPRAPKQEQVILSAQQVHDLAQTVPEHYSALIYALAYLGLRWGEAAGLRYRHIKDGEAHIVETLTEVGGVLETVSTKNHKKRVLPIPDFLIPMLGTGEGYVFTTESDTPLRNSNFRSNIWNPAVEKLGIEATPHDLRHTCVSLLVKSGANPKVIQEYLGHSSIQVTMDTYAHLMPDELPLIAAALDNVAKSVAKSAQSGSNRPESGQISTITTDYESAALHVTYS